MVPDATMRMGRVGEGGGGKGGMGWKPVLGVPSNASRRVPFVPPALTTRAQYLVKVLPSTLNT